MIVEKKQNSGYYRAFRMKIMIIFCCSVVLSNFNVCTAQSGNPCDDYYDIVVSGFMPKADQSDVMGTITIYKANKVNSITVTVGLLDKLEKYDNASYGNVVAGAVKETDNSPDPSVHTWSAEFHYNQNDFTAKANVNGYSIYWFAEVNAEWKAGGTVTHCNHLQCPVKAPHYLARIENLPTDKAYFTNSNVIKFTIYDPLPQQGLEYRFLTKCFANTLWEKCVTIDAIPSQKRYEGTMELQNGAFNVYNWKLVVRNKKYDFYEAQHESQIHYFLTEGDLIPFFRNYVLLPNEKAKFAQFVTPLFPTNSMESVLKIPYAAPGKNVTARDNQEYHFIWGNGDVLVRTKAEMDNNISPTYAYPAIGTYKFDYCVKYRERDFDGFGKQKAIRNMTKGIENYQVSVADFKVRYNSTTIPKPASSLQDAVAIAQELGKGFIYIYHSQNTDNHAVDLTGISVPITIYVKSKDMKINGKTVKEWDPDVTYAYSDVDGWYGATLIHFNAKALIANPEGSYAKENFF